MASSKDSEEWVIPPERIPVRPSSVFWVGLVVWLFMDRYHFPVWAVGAIVTSFSLIFLGTIFVAYRAVKKDIVFKAELEEESTSPFKKLWSRGRMS
jgi:hypothetical protein